MFSAAAARVLVDWFRYGQPSFVGLFLLYLYLYFLGLLEFVVLVAPFEILMHSYKAGGRRDLFAAIPQN